MRPSSIPCDRRAWSPLLNQQFNQKGFHLSIWNNPFPFNASSRKRCEEYRNFTATPFHSPPLHRFACDRQRCPREFFPTTADLPQMAERAAAADAEIRERPARRAGSCREAGGGSGYNSDQRRFLCDDFTPVTECLSQSVVTDFKKFFKCPRENSRNPEYVQVYRQHWDQGERRRGTQEHQAWPWMFVKLEQHTAC